MRLVTLALGFLALAGAAHAAQPSPAAVKSFVRRAYAKAVPLTDKQIMAISKAMGTARVRTVELYKPTLDDGIEIYLPKKVAKAPTRGIPAKSIVIVERVEETPDRYSLLPMPARWLK